MSFQRKLCSTSMLVAAWYASPAAADLQIHSASIVSTTLYIDDDFQVQDGISTLTVGIDGMKLARAQSDSLAATILSDLAPATAAGTVLTPKGDSTIDIADAWLAQAAGAGCTPPAMRGRRP